MGSYIVAGTADCLLWTARCLWAGRPVGGEITPPTKMMPVDNFTNGTYQIPITELISRYVILYPGFQFYDPTLN